MSIIDKNEISMYLRKKTGKTIAQFAKSHNVSPRAIHYGMNGKGSRHIRIIIAKVFEIPPSMLWDSNPKDVRVVDDLHYFGMMS